MNFNKKVMVTKHAVERMSERRVEMTPKKYKKYIQDQERFIKGMLRVDRIQKIIPKGDVSHVVTKGGYVVVVAEKRDCNLILTVIKRSRERIAKMA